MPDRDTGLIRFGWRDYDPVAGRFTAPDPARDMRGDGDTYDYCMDDPVGKADPGGLWALEHPYIHPFPRDNGDRKIHTPYDGVSDDEGNQYKDILGVYRGVKPGIYQKSSLIFQTQSGGLFSEIGANKGQVIAGSTTPEYGPVGAVSGPAQAGATRLFVYGDPETGKATSWEVYVWERTGKKWPDSNGQIYGWCFAPNAKLAQERPSFQKCLRNYIDSKSGKLSKP